MIVLIKSERMNKGAFPLFWLYELYDLTGEATVIHNGKIIGE